MPRVSRSVALADDIVASAAKWYAENAVPRAFRRVHPKVLRRVAKMAKGDWQRCVVNPDGSVTVHNQRVWERSSE